MKKHNKSVEIKRNLLKLSFGDNRKEWEGLTDDRCIFCNIYDMLIESLEEMENVESNFVWCAFNEKFNEEFKTLKKIKQRFSK